MQVLAPVFLRNMLRELREDLVTDLRASLASGRSFTTLLNALGPGLQPLLRRGAQPSHSNFVGFLFASLFVFGWL